jgi:hypothetical protein
MKEKITKDIREKFFLQSPKKVKQSKNYELLDWNSGEGMAKIRHVDSGLVATVS